MLTKCSLYSAVEEAWFTVPQILNPCPFLGLNSCIIDLFGRGIKLIGNSIEWKREMFLKCWIRNDSRVRELRAQILSLSLFKLRLDCPLAMWPWESYLTSLCLGLSSKCGWPEEHQGLVSWFNELIYRESSWNMVSEYAQLIWGSLYHESLQKARWRWKYTR